MEPPGPGDLEIAARVAATDTAHRNQNSTREASAMPIQTKPSPKRAKRKPKRVFTPAPPPHPMGVAVRLRRRKDIIAAIEADPDHARAGTERWAGWVIFLDMLSWQDCLAALFEHSPGLAEIEPSFWGALVSSLGDQRVAELRAKVGLLLSQREAGVIRAGVGPVDQAQEAVVRAGARRL